MEVESVHRLVCLPLPIVILDFGKVFTVLADHVVKAARHPVKGCVDLVGPRSDLLHVLFELLDHRVVIKLFDDGVGELNFLLVGGHGKWADEMDADNTVWKSRKSSIGFYKFQPIAMRTGSPGLSIYP